MGDGVGAFEEIGLAEEHEFGVERVGVFDLLDATKPYDFHHAATIGENGYEALLRTLSFFIKTQKAHYIRLLLYMLLRA